MSIKFRQFVEKICCIVNNTCMNTLRKLRKERKLTQQQVADAIGLGMQAYSYYEKGDRQPSPETLCKLADFFGVSVDEILGRVSYQDIFDDARVDSPEILRLYCQMSPEEQSHLVNYARGIISGRELHISAEKLRHAQQ